MFIINQKSIGIYGLWDFDNIVYKLPNESKERIISGKIMISDLLN